MIWSRFVLFFFVFMLPPPSLLAEVIDFSKLSKFAGKKVEVLGIIMPLDFSGKKMSKAIYVPWFLGCNHVPMPDESQTILIHFPKGKEIEVPSIPEYMVLKGLLKKETFKHEYAQAAYTLTFESLRPATQAEVLKNPYQGLNHGGF